MNPPPTPKTVETAEQRRGQRLLFVALVMAALLNFPLLGTADLPARLGGVPVLYLYVLVCWIGVVGLTGWLVRRGR